MQTLSNHGRDWKMPPSPGPVAIVAPFGRDAALIQARLADVGLAARVYPSVRALVPAVKADRLGALLITTEAIGPGMSDRLAQALREQPAWSDVPMVLLAARGQSMEEVLHQLQTSPAERSVTILERPVQSAALVTACRSALRARARQYQVRSLLQQLEDANTDLERRVQQRTRDVRQLATDLTMAEQRERRRIATLLHDHLQQLLFGLQFKLHLAQDAAGSGEGPAPDSAVGEVLSDADEIIAEAVDVTRTLTVDLSPPVLAHEGLETMFEWVGHQFKELHGVDVDVQGHCIVEQEHLRVLLFQAGRELLFNAVKHSDVDRVQVRVDEVRGECRIHVADEGAGFDPSAVEEEHDVSGGFGLTNIRERLGLVGGWLELAARPGAGTRVTVGVPLHGDG